LSMNGIVFSKMETKHQFDLLKEDRLATTTQLVTFVSALGLGGV